jgi:hypothetical protein
MVAGPMLSDWREERSFRWQSAHLWSRRVERGRVAFAQVKSVRRTCLVKRSKVEQELDLWATSRVFVLQRLGP